MILSSKKKIALYALIPFFLLIVTIIFNFKQGIRSLSDIKLDMPESAMRSLNSELICSTCPRIDFKKTQYEFRFDNKGLKYYVDCINGKSTFVNITAPSQGFTREEALKLMLAAIPLNKQHQFEHDDSDIKFSDAKNALEHFDFGSIHADLFYKPSDGSQSRVSLIEVFTLNAE